MKNVKVEIKKRYFYKDREVTKPQARAIKSLGGEVVTDRNDEWVWRNWT